MLTNFNIWDKLLSSHIGQGWNLLSRIKISIFTDISVLEFYGYIGDISIFINYSKFKYIFNLYIKISLKVYEMKIFNFLSYRLDFLQFFIIINDSNY